MLNVLINSNLPTNTDSEQLWGGFPVDAFGGHVPRIADESVTATQVPLDKMAASASDASGHVTLPKATGQSSAKSSLTDSSLFVKPAVMPLALISPDTIMGIPPLAAKRMISVAGQKRSSTFPAPLVQSSLEAKAPTPREGAGSVDSSTILTDEDVPYISGFDSSADSDTCCASGVLVLHSAQAPSLRVRQQAERRQGYRQRWAKFL